MGMTLSTKACEGKQELFETFEPSVAVAVVK